MLAIDAGTGESWAVIVTAGLTVGTVVVGFAIRNFRRWLKGEVDEVKKQVTGNGGDSDQTGDRIVRIEETQKLLLLQQAETAKKLDELVRTQAEANARFEGLHRYVQAVDDRGAKDHDDLVRLKGAS